MALIHPDLELPWTGLYVEKDVRQKLAGLHFAKEALSEHEREILYIAEGLLRLVDALYESEPEPAPVLE